jgi:hypothetical protein
MTETYTIRTAPEWQGVRIARLETPPAPAATARPAATTTLSRGERLRRGYAMLTDAGMRAAFRRRFWKELAS